MGAMVNGTCMANQATAVATFFSASNLISTQNFYEHVLEDSIWYQKLWQCASGCTTATPTWTMSKKTILPIPVFPDCNVTEGFSDGLVIGWGIASALVAVAALKFIRRGAS